MATASPLSCRPWRKRENSGPVATSLEVLYVALILGNFFGRIESVLRSPWNSERNARNKVAWVHLVCRVGHMRAQSFTTLVPTTQF